MDYILNIKDEYPEMLEVRRYLHANPEIGFELDNTVSFIKKKLDEYGIEHQDIGKCGIVAKVGNDTGKAILLRADMDALPIIEESGLDFASKNDFSHACGHDMHTTILLFAAKLLKKNENQLKGCVKFIFQPAEELLVGGKAMIESGVLENPKVDVAMGLHVVPNTPVTGVALRGGGPWMTSANNFWIVVTGSGSHGAMPHTGIDPVYIASQIVIGSSELTTRELPFDNSAVITFGKFIANGSMNIIPSNVILEGTIRTFSNQSREYIKNRFPEIIKSIASTYRGSAEIEFLCDCPVLINDDSFSKQVIHFIHEISDNNFDIYDGVLAHASEDFAYYANEVPSFFFNLCNPLKEENKPLYPVHHPKVVFDEKMMPIGSAIMAHTATRWLEENSK